MASNCPACEHLIDDPAASFCPRCGTPLGAVGPTQQPDDGWGYPAPRWADEPGDADRTTVAPSPLGLDADDDLDPDDLVDDAYDIESYGYDGEPHDGDDHDDGGDALAIPSWAEHDDPPVHHDPPAHGGRAARRPTPRLDPTAGWNDRRSKLAIVLAVLGGLLAVVGAAQTWLQIRIGGVAAPGSAETGLGGSGGKAVVVAGLLAIGAGACVALAVQVVSAKRALLVAGVLTTVIGVVNLADVQSKATDIQAEFGIPASDVVADAGDGLYLTLAAGVAMLASGASARGDGQPDGPPRRT